MTLADYFIAGPPDMARDDFIKVLADAGSPAALEGGDMYAALLIAGVRPSVFLAFFRQESGFGTANPSIVHDYGTKNPGNVRSLEDPTLGTVIATRGGNFAKYPTWTAGTLDWGKRLRGPKYAGAGLLTVRQALPTYAPSSDSNDPQHYADTVLAFVEAHASAPGGPPVTGHVPRPPIDDLIAQTTRNKIDGVGFDRMDHDRVPGATVLHSMAGTLGSCINYFPLPTTQALTDFGIGNVAYKGTPYARIVQFNDIHGRLEGWASGPVGPSPSNPNGRPQGDGPAWLAHIGGAGAVNEVGDSIEHDDTTRPDGTVGPVAQAAVSPAQWASSIWLQAYLHAEEIGQTADTYAWNMHHREIVGSAYKDCPGHRIYDFTDEYQAGVKAIMRHFQSGTPYPAGGIVINGMTIATPPEGGTVPVPTPTPPTDTISKALVAWFATLPKNAQGDTSPAVHYEATVRFDLVGFPTIQGNQRAIIGEYVSAWFYPDGTILCIHPEVVVKLRETPGALTKR